MNKIYIISFLLLLSILTKGQTILTLEKAVEIALENNNTIKIAKKTTEIAKNSTKLGNSGYMPTITGNLNRNQSINNTTLQFPNTPSAQTISGAQSSSYGANLQANYILFGGLSAKYNFKKLKINKDAATIQERLNIETIILQVSQTYFNVLQTQTNLTFQQESIKISKERLNRAKIKQEIAGGSHIDYLNAQVDFNTDSTNYINAQNNMHKALLNLKQLLNSSNNFTVDTNIILNKNLNLNELKALAKETNSSLLNSEYNYKIAQINSKINRSSLMPRLSINGTYNFNHSENDAGTLLFSEISGISGGLQLSVPIWDGHKKSIQYQNTKTNIAIAELNQYEIELILNKELDIAFSNYKNAISISKMDKVNIETAQLNFERSNEMFKIGQINNTEFRTAQLNLLRIENQSSVNKINIKLAEIDLMRLSGQLLR